MLYKKIKIPKIKSSILGIVSITVHLLYQQLMLSIIDQHFNKWNLKLNYTRKLLSME